MHHDLAPSAMRSLRRLFMVPPLLCTAIMLAYAKDSRSASHCQRGLPPTDCFRPDSSRSHRVDRPLSRPVPATRTRTYTECHKLSEYVTGVKMGRRCLKKAAQDRLGACAVVFK